MTSNQVTIIKSKTKITGYSHFINWLIYFLFAFLVPLAVQGDSNSKPFFTKSDLIVDSFVIKPGTIIRTSDSLAAGAKYISETEMSSNQQCLLWCWDNRNCTLAVYEEKNQGSCYLFDCGPPDQMKCKFTGHDHYTSSLIKFNRNDNDGNSAERRNQVNHENDLVNLRISSSSTKLTSNHSSNGNSITSTTSGSLVPPPSSATTFTSTSASVNVCKRHQFQCRNTSDCIAIYNVCDGIVQCPDGSDEAADLHCPSSDSPVYPSIESQVQPTNLNKNHQRGINYSGQIPKSDEGEVQGKDSGIPGGPGLTRDHERGFIPKKIISQEFNYPKSPDFAADVKEVNGKGQVAHKYSDYNSVRDKYESKPFYPSYGNQFYQPPPPPPPPPPSSANDFYNGPRSRGFVNDADYPSSFSRDVNYWQPESGVSGSGSRSNGLDHSSNLPNYHQYRVVNDLGPGNGRSQQSNSQNPMRNGPWQKNSYMNYRQKPADYPTSIDGSSAPKMDLIESPGQSSVERHGNVFRTIPTTERSAAIRKPKNSQSLAEDLKEHASKATSVSSILTSQAPVSVAPTDPRGSAKSFSHLASDKMVHNWNPPVAVSHLSSSKSGRDTNSAVIALVLGVGITAMLIALVGCRMKYIKRRIARRGRNLAHDADYLVNGMYL